LTSEREEKEDLKEPDKSGRQFFVQTEDTMGRASPERALEQLRA
jgi:hypothetical protein